MEEKKTNFFCIPAFSFVPQKYAELVKNSAGKIFGAILCVFIILGIITGFNVTSGLNKVANELSQSCPNFELSRGSFSIEKPFAMNEEGVYIVIDDSLTDIDDAYIKSIVLNGDQLYSQVLVLGGDSMGMYNNGQVNSIELSQLGDFSFSKDSLINELIPAFKPILFAVIVGFNMIYVGFYYLAALIMSLFTAIICKIFKKDIDSTSRFRMTVLTKLPIYLIVFFIELFTPLTINILIAAILVIIYTAVVVKLFNEEDEVGYDVTNL